MAEYERIIRNISIEEKLKSAMADNKRGKIQTGSSRRNVLKLAGAGASTLALPGMAAAGSSSEKPGAKTRAEKAAEEGYKWDKSWVNEDRIGDNWVDIEKSVNTQDSRSIDVTIGVQGINVNISGYFGECEGWVEISALGQSRRSTVTCSRTCRSNHIDGGAAYLDAELCFNWDTKTLSAEVEGCVWHLTDWTCDSVHEEI